MADAFGEYTHTIAGLYYLVQLVKCFGVVGVITMLLARVHGNRTRCIQERHQHFIFPEFGVCHEVQWPPAALCREQPAIHQRIGVITCKYDRAFRWYVLGADDIYAPKKSVSYSLKKPDDEMFAHLTTPIGESLVFPDPHYIKSNGINMAVYEQGDGPAVILLHGFPELAFSWRHQLPALADAGFRAIAVDQRGYGNTDAPPNVEDYCADELIADVHGLLDALDLESAIFVGHDWGALVLWYMAMLAPERIERLIILNIPHSPRPPVDPIQIFRQRFGDDFYIVNFQDSDEADRAFAADTTHFFDMMMRKNQVSRAQFDQLPPERKSLSLLQLMAREKAGGQPLLTDDERDYFANAFAKSGFTGPINWYRNWTRNWERLEGVEQTIDIPTLFIGAVDDVIISPEYIEGMNPLVTDLEVHMLEPCGHWSQQEHPEQVNQIILDWLG
jgi:pimeloyl-ACP methyl ester carboxylesterase